MKKIITLAIIAAAAITATNANAISEGYRKKLEKEQETQFLKAHASNSTFTGLRQYSGGKSGMYEIEGDKNCKIHTVNAFPPKPAKRIDSTLTIYPSSLDVTFLAFTTPTGCKYLYSYMGEVSELVAK